MKLLRYITLSLCLIGLKLSGQNAAASLTTNQTIQNATLIAPLNELIEITIDLYDLPFSRQVDTYLNDSQKSYNSYSGLNPFNYNDIHVELTLINSRGEFLFDGFYDQSYFYIDASGNPTSNEQDIKNWKEDTLGRSFKVRFSPLEKEAMNCTLNVSYYNERLNQTTTINVELPFTQIQVINSDELSRPIRKGQSLIQFDSEFNEISPILYQANITYQKHGWPTPDMNFGLGDLHIQRNQDLLNSYIQEGYNFFRIPLMNFTYNMENSYLNQYEHGLMNLWELDKIFKLAESYNVLLYLDIDHNVNTIAQSVDNNKSQWDQSPYNANGVNQFGFNTNGPCTNKADFFTAIDARNSYRNKIRYLIARYSYSNSLALYEIINEFDHMYTDTITNSYYWSDSSFRNTVKSWIYEMSNAISSYDSYYGRSIGASYAKDVSESIISDGLFDTVHKELDVVMFHKYGVKDIAPLRRYQELRKLRAFYGDKLLLLNETGVNAFAKKNNNYYLSNLPDKITSIALRQSAIVTFFANPMITDAHWYSKDVYNNSGHINSLVGLKGIENVLKNYSNYSPSSSIDTCNNYSSDYTVYCSSAINTDKVNAFALIADDKNFATVYLLNHTANYLNTTIVQNDSTFQPDNYYPDLYQDAGVVTTMINGFKPFRDYVVNFYNPSTGQIINSTEIVLTTDQSGQLAISEQLIPFEPNIEQGGDLLITIEVCSNYYSRIKTCGYDEVFINYFMPKLMNSKSWDINGNDIYFIDNSGNLNSCIKNNGSYVITHVGSLPNVNPNTQIQIGQSNVFFVGTDDNVYLISKSGGPIYPVTNGSYVDPSTHFAYNPTNHKLFFIGSDRLIYNSYYNGYAWITNKLTANAIQAKTDSEIIFNGSGKVYFIGIDSRIHEYYWSQTQYKWFEQLTSQNSSAIHGVQFGFTPGNLSYFNANGNLTILKWQNNSWIEYPGTIPNTPDLSSDVEISGGLIYYLSDGKLQCFSLMDMEYVMELDFCAVRGDLNAKLKIENSTPFITNIDERLSTYNYLGACKSNSNTDFNYNSENTSSFSIYPNPSTNGTFLLKNHDIPYTNISIVNSLGEILIRDVYNSAHEYRANELKAGIYFVWIYNQDKVVDVAKLIITE